MENCGINPEYGSIKLKLVCMWSWTPDVVASDESSTKVDSPHSSSLVQRRKWVARPLRALPSPPKICALSSLRLELLVTLLEPTQSTRVYVPVSSGASHSLHPTRLLPQVQKEPGSWTPNFSKLTTFGDISDTAFFTRSSLAA